MKEKIWNFLKQYKMPVFLALITIMLFFGGVCAPLWIVASLLTILFFAVCSTTEILGVLLYSISFSGIGLHYIISLIGAFVVITVRYGIDVAKKRKEFYVLPFAITCLIVVVWSCVHYHIDSAGFEQGALLLALMFGIYLMFVSYDKVDIHKCFSYLIFGFAVSMIFSPASLIFDNYSVALYHFDGTYKRFQFLNYHYNTVAMIALFSVSYYIYAMFNNKGKWWENAIAIAVSFVIGIMTLSKAFMLVCVGFVCYAGLMIVLKYKKKSLKILLPALAVMLVLGVVFRELLFKFLNRFTYLFTESNLLDQITTGRYSIWCDYVSQIVSSIPQMLFGVGFFSQMGYVLGPHSVFVHILYRVGFIGIIALCMLVYVYAKNSKSKPKLTLSNCLPILTWLFLALEEQVFSDRFFLFLVFAFMLTLVPKTEKNENN